ADILEAKVAVVHHAAGPTAGQGLALAVVGPVHETDLGLLQEGEVSLGIGVPLGVAQGQGKELALPMKIGHEVIQDHQEKTEVNEVFCRYLMNNYFRMEIKLKILIRF
ncbi:hypothetical protein Avbf_10866, partial [Armadillidium vulgare]